MNTDYDIHSLKRCLCCTNKFHYIIDVANKLNKTELMKLRDSLRSATALNRMHTQLENHFDALIKSKSKTTKTETTSTPNSIED